MYESLAIIYDSFTDDIDYDRWANDIYDAINRYAKMPVLNIADLACGTGNITIKLAKMGYNMVGVDISEEMLIRAGENMRRAGVRCNFIHQDMTVLKLHKKVDTIVCACDGINYLVNDGQLAQFFESCKTQLKTGGLLIFDISSEDKLGSTLGNNSYFDIREDACIFWQNSVSGKIVNLELNIFLRQDDGKYIRMTEIQQQRIYSQEEIKASLQGFELLDIKTVNYDKNNLDKRLQFVCRLKEQ